MVSQKEIADAVGVSIMTVSRAVRNHPDLSPETRRRILEKAAELGYRLQSPTHADSPQSAVRRVGVLVCEPSGEGSYRYNEGVPYRILSAVQASCKQRGVEVLIETFGVDETPQLARNGSVDRAFLFGRYTTDTLARLGSFPVLALSSYIESETLPRVTADNEGGIRALVEYLFSLGHRKIHFLSTDEGPLTELFRARENSYFAEMCRRGLAPVSLTLPSRYPLPREEVLKFVGDASAVMCCADHVAYHLDELLRRENWKLPERCSITGFDNAASFRSGYLTTYEPDWEWMGRVAVTALLDQFEAFQNRPVRVLAPGKLVLRESTCSPAAS